MATMLNSPIPVAKTRELLPSLAFPKNQFATDPNLPTNYRKCLVERRLEGALNKMAITAGIG